MDRYMIVRYRKLCRYDDVTSSFDCLELVSSVCNQIRQNRLIVLQDADRPPNLNSACPGHGRADLGMGEFPFAHARSIS